MSEIYIGLMSGSSLDGIDGVIVDFSHTPLRFLNSHYQPYETHIKEQILALHTPAHNELHQAEIIGIELARSYAKVVKALLEKAKINSKEISAIGCHGQTIRHQPTLGYTIQLGNAALLAELCNITVISDFRQRDIAAGGQGAPLVPAFHDYVFRHSHIHRVIVNIGGISNLTSLKPNAPVVGFDCGPGNILMDAWINQNLGKLYDLNGDWATSGKVIPNLLNILLKESFFNMPPPKSTGRDLFNLNWLERSLKPEFKPQDVQNTLLKLTAISISQAVTTYCQSAQEIYLCGGGALNSALVKELESQLFKYKIKTTSELGIDVKLVEAIAFAWLARQTTKQKCSNLPEVTGAHGKRVLGTIQLAH